MNAKQGWRDDIRIAKGGIAGAEPNDSWFGLLNKRGSAMDQVLTALEVAGEIDEQRRLHLDAPLPIPGPSRVRVIILVPEQTDLDEREWLGAAGKSSAFDFLKEPAEDIYSLQDGKPFRDPP
jgi:hypothetical protein